MRELVVRRHSRRERPGQHLTQWGISLARRAGRGAGPFDLVVTSPLPRCVETAVAMGFAVDQTDQRLAGPGGQGENYPEMELVDQKDGRASLRRLIARGGPVAAFAREQADIWREIASRAPEGGRALIVSHGGAFLDGVVLVLAPDAAAFGVGPLASYCGGVWLRLDGPSVSAAEIRVPTGG